EIPEHDVVVLGNSVSTQKSSRSPLTGVADEIERLKREDSGTGKTFVVLAHGSVDLAGRGGNFPIAKQEIANLGADYLALGDWHGSLDVSQGGQSAHYPGSIEVLKPDQPNSGTCLYVQVDQGNKTLKQGVGKVTVEHINISKFK